MAGAVVVLGLPAPRQSHPRRARRRRDLAEDRRPRRATTSSTRPRSSTRSPSARTSTPSPTAGATPATSATRPGWWSWTRGRPACSTRENRSMLDDDELDWLDEQMRGDVDHLLVGTSLPFLLSPGLHYVEAWSEALAERRLGSARREGRREAPAARRPRALGGVPGRLPEGARADPRGGARRARGGPADRDVPLRRRAPQLRVGGPPEGPATTPIHEPDHPGGLLADPQPDAAGGRGSRSPVLSYGVAGPIGHVVARSAKVPDLPVDWRLVKGPWFDNNLATLEVRRPRAAHVVGDRRGRGRPARPAALRPGRRGRSIS